MAARETTVSARSHHFWQEVVRKECSLLAPRDRANEDEPMNPSTAGIAFGLAGTFVNPTFFPKGIVAYTKQRPVAAAGQRKQRSHMMEALIHVMGQNNTRTSEDPRQQVAMPPAGRAGTPRPQLEAVTAPGCVGRQGVSSTPTPSTPGTPRRAWAADGHAAYAPRPRRPTSSRPSSRLSMCSSPIPGADAGAHAAALYGINGGATSGVRCTPPSTPRSWRPPSSAGGAFGDASFQIESDGRPPAGLQNSYRAETHDFIGSVLLTPGRNGKRRAPLCGHGMNGCSEGGWVGSAPVADAYRATCDKFKTVDRNGSADVAETMGSVGHSRPIRPRSFPLGGSVDHAGRFVEFIDTRLPYHLDVSEEDDLMNHLTARTPTPASI